MTTDGQYTEIFLQKEGKLKANAMKRVAAGAHLPRFTTACESCPQTAMRYFESAFDGKEKCSWKVRYEAHSCRGLER